MTDASSFQRQLGQGVAELFDGEFKFYRSSLELRRQVAGGVEVVTLAGSNKFSPHISVGFYFGKRFSEVTAVEKRLGLERMGCHVQQYSLNAQKFAGLRYSGETYWEVDIRSNHAELPSQLHRTIAEIAFPFFTRFANLRTARDAIAQGDSWCFGGPAFWHCLLRLDAALGELDHFVEWSKCLAPFDAEQAAAQLNTYFRAK